MKSCLLVLVSIGLGACGGADDASVAANDAMFPDAVVDTTQPETQGDATPSDTAPADGREIEAPLTGLKDDPTYLVPGNIARKTGVVAGGDRLAWIEGSDDAPQLVVWDLTSNIGPRAFSPPTLLHPRELALSDSHLVYVDDRYGDPDVFGIVLTTGAELTVVRRAGAQEGPTIFGTRVAWEDCTRCVTGDGLPGQEALREIHERDLAGGAERSLTNDVVADRAPRYGLVGDRPAIVWLRERATLRLEGVLSPLSVTIEVADRVLGDQQVAGASLWDGMIAWRPSPLIVNPDSMIVNPDSMFPSDVMVTEFGTRETSAVTTHAELAGGMDLAIETFAARAGWLEIEPGDPTSSRVVVGTTDGGAGVVLSVDRAKSLGVGRDFVVFTAPRDDNDGEEDVHVLRLDLP